MEAAPTPTELSKALERAHAAIAEAVKAQGQAVFWHFEYLALYLLPHTRAILGFLAKPENMPWVAIPHVEASVLPANPGERQAVLVALTHHGLIELLDGGNIEVTPRGRMFLRHMETVRPYQAVAPDPNPPYAPPPRPPGAPFPQPWNPPPPVRA